MKTKEIKLSEVKEAEYNPRKISEKQLEQLKKSLKRYGCVSAVSY